MMSRVLARAGRAAGAEVARLDPLAQLLDLGAVDGASVPRMILKPLSSGGLWLPVIMHAAVGARGGTPRSRAPACGTTPTSMTSRPAASRPRLQGGVQARRGDAAVAPERDGLGARLDEVGADGAPQIGDEVVGEVALGDAADVVLAKDSRVH